MFLLTTGELPMAAADKLALVAFVRSGGGLIGFHSATDTFHHWPAYMDDDRRRVQPPPPPEHPAADRDRHPNPATHGLPGDLP